MLFVFHVSRLLGGWVAAPSEGLDPPGRDAAGGHDPFLCEVVVRGDDAAARYLAEAPRGAVEEDVGEDARDDPVCDVVRERDDDDSEERRDRVAYVVPVDLARPGGRVRWSALTSTGKTR